MGRHRATTTHWTPATGRLATSAGAARYVGRVGALAVALGVGAAVAGGTAIATADDTAHDSSAGMRSTGAHDGDAGVKDPQSDGSRSRRPGMLKSALRVPRMVLGANGGAPTSTPHPGGIRVKTRPTNAGGAADASIDSISSLPRRATRLAGDERTAGAVGPSARPRGTANTKPNPEPAVAATNPRLTTQSAAPTAALAPQVAPGARTDDAPLAPAQSLLGVLGLISRDIEQSLDNAVHQSSPTTTSQTTPSPDDVVDTPYGPIGKWMLRSEGEQVANWGGQAYGDKTLSEPVNVIIVDPNSRSPEESTAKLNSAMFWSGFPAQPIHSTGFSGNVFGTTYDQLPADGTAAAYSDLPFFLPNDHARVFGPAPVAAVDGTGYVWSAAASTEVPGIYANQFTHRYLSYDLARDVLALRLILSGQATFVGVQKMDNVYNDGTVSTGDHDGYAIVLRLN